MALVQSQQITGSGLGINPGPLLRLAEPAESLRYNSRHPRAEINLPNALKVAFMMANHRSALSYCSHKLSLFLLILIACASLHAQTAESYGIVESRDVMIAMRDGVKLAADIYRPARDGQAVEGKFPVLLMRTPYNKERADSSAKAFVPHGYVVVLEDVRGRYKSEGHWMALATDPEDGFDTAKWIGDQPWCDGGIGTFGSSYAGATQHAMAIANAPFVKAMVPRNAMSDFGQYGVRHNGAFELRFFNWVFTLGNATGTPDALPAAIRAAKDPASAKALVDMGTDVRQYVHNLPLRPGTTPLKFAPDYEKWLIEAMSHGDYDDFWKNAGSSVVDHLAEYKDVPEYHTTGWYDSWGTPVANLNFVELRKSKKSLQRLIVGPWIHSSENLNYAGEAQFTSDAALDLNAFHLRWFDHFLKGVDNGVDREPPVRIYVMGGGDAHKTADGRIFVGGHWRDEQEWPLARTVYTPWYLHGKGAVGDREARRRRARHLSVRSKESCAYNRWQCFVAGNAHVSGRSRSALPCGFLAMHRHPTPRSPQRCRRF